MKPDRRDVKRSSVVLVGLPGSGKTSVGKALRDRHGWSWVDVDAEVERVAGRSIAELIRVEGEQQFRDLESRLLKEILERQTQLQAEPAESLRAVALQTLALSVGGGALTREANRTAVAEHGRPVHLCVSVEVAAERALEEEAAGRSNRPVLFPNGTAGGIDEATERLSQLNSEREAHYRIAALRVWTDFATPERVAEAVAAELMPELEGSNSDAGEVSAVTLIPALESTGDSGAVVIGPQSIRSLPRRIARAMPKATNVALIVDANVRARWGELLQEIFADSKLQTLVLEVASGEQQKSLGNVEQLANRMVQAGFTRDDVVVGVGGGVVGDLSGLVASLYMRGIAHVQIPTTVVAQVDSALGGKSGVNLPTGKNLIGTFHPPLCTISDPQLLTSLPEREYLSGLAEVVKYGAIFSKSFFEWLEESTDEILKRDQTTLSRVVELSSLFKTGVVARDLYDRTGLRAQLNFGHTIGHALEKLCGYGELLHGEAVAIGMIEAMRLGLMLGLTPEGDLSRVASLLQKLGLPTKIPARLLTTQPQPTGGVVGEAGSSNKEVPTEGDPNRVTWLKAIRADKKRSGAEIHFILLERIGKAKVVPVDPETVYRSIRGAAVL